MPKVSVIVPVYNVEQYLRQCLDSIVIQTMRDIEIICVDDGSTDSSGAILDQYAEMDERIRVLHKDNAGYGAAMNAGIALAAGEYIGIVESDDKVASKMYAVLYKTAKENNLDFVKSDAYYWFDKLKYQRRVHENALNAFYGQILGENERNLFFDFFMNIWTGIYKKEFLHQNSIVFNESPGASYQDNGFWMQTCFYAQRAMWLDEVFYYYRQDNPDASVKSTYKMLAMIKEYEYLERIIKLRRQDNLLPYVYAMKLIRLKGTFLRIEDGLKYELIDQIQKDYGKYKAFIKYNRYIDDWMREFLKAPQEYCDNLVKKKTEVKTKITESAGVVIYGAGKQGDIIMRILYNEGLYDKICCFAVSDESGNAFLGPISILKIEKAQECCPKALYVLAVTPGTKACSDMRTRLKQLGIHEYLQMTDFIEKFNYI
ncbi:MAG: glycosyltransferase [Ruminococcus flavefaciens]|nr:glycosyltransferase [Roseburia sp.]MCM1231434.1 glycosyltransferase [Ruminococcus flavefaciens]